LELEGTKVKYGHELLPKGGYVFRRDTNTSREESMPEVDGR
jgi:hypothetical protein